jgi:hypothetical protein
MVRVCLPNRGTVFFCRHIQARDFPKANLRDSAAVIITCVATGDIL